MVARRPVFRDNPQLYEINTAAWLYELSRKAGKQITLGNVPQEEWQRLRDLGTDLVWLMGVWRRSPWGRRIFENDPPTPELVGPVLPDWTMDDIIGSSYSIDGYEPDRLVGGWADIDRARTELHRLSMGLILDFIPNHTGPDFSWVTEHPEYYVQGTRADYEKEPWAFFPIRRKGATRYLAKGKDPNFCPWSDTVQLNYFNPAARAALVREIRKIAGHCDGVRCDMAQLVLNGIFRRTWGEVDRGKYCMPSQEFWEEAISQVSGLIWIAEAYWDTERTLQQMGFDYVYDKTTYDRLRWSSAYDVYLRLVMEIPFQQKLLRFIENHDEERCVTVFGRERSMAAATIIATVPGMKLYHQGQFEGKRVRLPVQIRRARHEALDSGIEAFYHKLLSITKQDIFHQGNWRIKEVLAVGPDNSFRNLLAYLLHSEAQTKVVVVNFSGEAAQGRLPLENDVAPEAEYVLVDELNDQRYERSGRSMAHPGLHVMLGSYRAHIFDLQPLK